MAGMETQQGGLPFTLARIAPALAGYAPPKREFDPSTSWTHVYDVYTVAHNGFNGLGRLAITRREAGQNTFPLRIEIQRNGISGYHQFARAELICQNDALATPATWTFETKLAKTADDEPFRMSGIRKLVTLQNHRLIVKADALTNEYPIEGPATARWCLFEAVQRLNGASTAPLEFTILNEFDRPEGQATLTYHGNAMVQLAGGPRVLTAYRLTGQGILPTIYWVDAAGSQSRDAQPAGGGQGRLLFCLSGIHVFILAEADGQAISYPRDGRIGAARNPNNRQAKGARR